tara:strand:+ start:758 stop:1261 length:504 start_codon:yes stop_codon:yes gene_type:complete
MENETKINSSEKITNFVQKNKNIIVINFILIISVLVGISYFNYYQKSKNEKISEKFVQAGIYLSLNKQEESKKIYKQVISSKNKFYSILALNNILDNDLEQSNEEVLKLFDIVENIKIEKEQKNLIKLKKALYLIKISRDNEGKKLLDEIISDNSIWKEAASEISKL